MAALTDRIEDAVNALREGGLIAYPTEAVYGLGCDPSNLAAVQRLLAVKNRPPEKGLILIAADLAQLLPWLQPLTPEQQARVLPTWPGPHTWLLPAKTEVAELLRGQHATLAVRVTAHPLAAALCRACGHALVSTSANLSDAPPAKSAAECLQIFGADIDVILQGELGDLSRPTPIRDATSGKILRG